MKESLPSAPSDGDEPNVPDAGPIEVDPYLMDTEDCCLSPDSKYMVDLMASLGADMDTMDTDICDKTTVPGSPTLCRQMDLNSFEDQSDIPSPSVVPTPKVSYRI